MPMNDIQGVIPFTELTERVMTLGKTDSFNYRDFIKGLTNDIYTRVLPRQHDWTPITEESSITTVAPYTTGSLSATVGSTAITGVGTTWTATMTAANGWKIKFAGSDIVYKFTYASATTATISPAFANASNISGQSYVLFCDTYQLASDFDRFLRNGSFYVYNGGRLSDDPVMESPNDLWRADYTPAQSDPIKRIILRGVHTTTAAQLLQVNPWPNGVKNYPYEYIKKIVPMYEYYIGTVSATTGSTNITGVGTLWTTHVNVGDYFRVDSTGKGDSSVWYRVASVTDDTHLVLETVYNEETVVSESYTTCSAPSSFPSKFHEFILYEAVTRVLATQDDPALQSFLALRNDILNGLYKDYKGRRTNSQIGVEDGGYRS